MLGDPKWSHDGFEYLRGFEDAFNDPLVRKITIMKSGQTGFTQAMLNIIGYIMDLAPGPTLVLYPTETNCKRFAKRKLEPMLRDTPKLHGRVADPRLKDGSNSTFEKSFPDGFLSIISAMSVNNLSMQSIMYLIIDELDRIARTAGNEGDTVEVVSKRLQGFKEVSKWINISTPTIAGASRIEAEYLSSNMQRFHLPCTHCGEFQVLKFAQLKGWRIDKGIYRPEETYYECTICDHHLFERDKYIMLKEGKWIAEKPEIIDHAGLHISELYSTLSTWEEIIRDFIPKKENRFKLQTFVNLVLGETFEDNEIEIPESELMLRCEPYNASNLPEKILLLTAAGDVQKDRIEVGVKGWGLGEESWLVDYQVFPGDPEILYSSTDENNLWYRVELFFDTKYRHEAGVFLRLMAAGIDAGYATKAVQYFIKRMHKKGKRWVFALQGDKGIAGVPVLNRGSVNNRYRVKQFTIGTATAKNIIFSRLAIDEYGPGYMHFPNTLDEEYFKQLTAEKRVSVYEKGIEVRKKWVKIRSRNEALDIEVYNLAALDFINVNLEAYSRNFNAKLERIKAEKIKEVEEEKEGTSILNPASSIKKPVPANTDSSIRRKAKKLKQRSRNFAKEW